MNYKYVNISQLALFTGLDRRTVSNHLKDITPSMEKSNEKLYRACFAYPLLIHRSGKRDVDWDFLVSGWLNSEAEKLKSPKK